MRPGPECVSRGTFVPPIGFIHIVKPACGFTVCKAARFDVMSRKFALAILLLIGVGVSACNTMEGAGQDIENTGEAIQNEANDAR